MNYQKSNGGNDKKNEVKLRTEGIKWQTRTNAFNEIHWGNETYMLIPKPNKYLKPICPSCLLKHTRQLK